MSREFDQIKFRHVFQHDGTKEIRFVFADLYEIARNNLPRIDSSIRWDWLTSDQFTGRKDRDSKEVYEGDVVSGPSENLYIVEWDGDSGSFRLKVPNTGLYISQNFSLVGSCRAVGSIHQNPHLLTPLLDKEMQ